VEVRSIWTSTELRGYLDFPYAAQVFAIRREVTEMVSQKYRSETVQGLSSLPTERATPARLTPQGNTSYLKDLEVNIRCKQGSRSSPQPPQISSTD
jgi:hypothetical protein